MRYFLCRAWYTSWETGGRLKPKKSNRHWAKLQESHESRVRLFAKSKPISRRFSVWCRQGDNATPYFQDNCDESSSIAAHHRSKPSGHLPCLKHHD